MILIPCSVYFPVGLNIICWLSILCLQAQWYSWPEVEMHCSAIWTYPYSLRLLQRLWYLIKHTSQSPTWDLIILDSIEGFMKVTWMLTDTKRQDRLSEPLGRLHYSIFVGLSCQHVNPQRAINNCSCIRIGDLKWTACFQRGLLYIELFLFMIICADAIKLVQNVSVSKCVRTFGLLEIGYKRSFLCVGDSC